MPCVLREGDGLTIDVDREMRGALATRLSFYKLRADVTISNYERSVYGVWNKISMWQYGGVEWNKSRGRSIAKHYNHGRWRSPEYFGNLDRPLERNAFNGSTSQLYGFWNHFAWNW